MKLDTLIQREIGTVTVTVETVIDEYPCYDWLGSFSEFKYDFKTGLYDMESCLMFDGSLWRNAKGQIQAEPEGIHNRTREYRFIDIGDCQFSKGDKHWLKYAFQNGERLRRFAHDYWHFIGIVATVELDGVEIGRNSLWGIESDSDDSYFESTARECAFEALIEAKAWKAKNLAA